jgi:hypothetical protein
MSREQAPRAAGKRPAASIGNNAGSDRRDGVGFMESVKERAV